MTRGRQRTSAPSVWRRSKRIGPCATDDHLMHRLLRDFVELEGECKWLYQRLSEVERTPKPPPEMP